MNKILGKFFIGDEIKEINNHLRLVYCLYSDSDPYLKYDDLENFAKSVLAEKCVIHDGGHLNSESGYLRFDKLLEVIKQIDNGMDFDESDDMPIRLNFIVTNVRD